MTKLLFFKLTLIFSLFFVQSASATTIELKDGSKITGQVISMSGGVYTIHSQSVGMLKIPQSKIRAIHEENSSLSADSVSGFDLNALHSRIRSDKQLQQSILNLQSDPQIQAILQDEELIKAVQGQDFEALMSNPKIIELMNNARIGEITRQLK